MQNIVASSATPTSSGVMERSTAGVSVVIPTWKRTEKLINSLRHILACDPLPAEVIVHVDAGDSETPRALQGQFPSIRVIVSHERMGPGGGRNRLIATANQQLVASFDDDSYPLDADYFAVLQDLFRDFPDASVIAGQINHEGEIVRPRDPSVNWVADFLGCGCAYRRAEFIATGGYVPLPVAYGMEEADLSLRLHDRGGRILFAKRLRVFHATNLAHHRDAAVTKASITNIALLASLRYPASFWWLGSAQVLNRIAWLLRNRRWRGVASGILGIPGHLRRYRQYRQPVSPKTLSGYLALRRLPQA